MKYVKIPEVAEDLTQDVFLKLWKMEEKIEEIEQMDAYILTIARNQVKDHFKRMAKDQQYLESVAANLNPRENSPQREIQIKELKRNLQLILDELPERQKEVYLSKYEEGLSMKEIAEKLGISPYTVKNHLTQALKFIRSRINIESYLTVSILLHWIHRL
jgi:RNA polymerase sigma-70 factor (ECF subfamily)